MILYKAVIFWNKWYYLYKWSHKIVLIEYTCVYISQGKCTMVVLYIGKWPIQQKTQIMLAVFIISLGFLLKQPQPDMELVYIQNC